MSCQPARSRDLNLTLSLAIRSIFAHFNQIISPFVEIWFLQIYYSTARLEISACKLAKDESATTCTEAIISPRQGTMSRKRQREAPNIDVQLVETYEDLANENEEIRLKAAHALVSKLSPENAPTGEQVERALTRLVRGLSSGRKAARIGFSIALTEILSQLLGPDQKDAPRSDITVERVLDILKKQTHAGGSVNGQVVF